MAKLTDTQLIVLSRAFAREDGIATIPDKLAKGAVAKVGSSLVARKLMREVKSKPGMPVWREDEDGRSIGLVITAAGRKAIAADTGTHDANAASMQPIESLSDRGEKRSTIPHVAEAAGSTPRAGSKQALVIEMLSAETGTTIDALVDATGWLPHTTRAALTGLRKRGFAIERSRGQGESSRYRLARKPAALAA